MAKKIVFLGGASGYFGIMLPYFARREGLRGSSIYLYDIDAERLKLMAGFARRISDEAGIGFRIYATTNLKRAVEGADFALASIGGQGGSGGGFHRPDGPHMKDLLISARYGIYQIVGDTAGPAAMMAAFRTVPIFMKICRAMEKYSPDVVFINHANPMAVLCRAVNKYTCLKDAIGICHGVQGGLMYAAELLGVPAGELDTIWIGTNHYYWFTKVYHKGRDVYPELKKKLAASSPAKNHVMSKKLSEIYGYHIVYPDDGHMIEFYPFLAQVKNARGLPYNLATTGHGPHVLPMYANAGLGGRMKKTKTKNPTRRQIIQEYKKFLDGQKLPEDASTETVGEMMEQISAGRRGVHIVNIPNRGAVPNLPSYAVLEVEGVTDSTGVRPLYMGEAPVALKGLLEGIIAWQEMVTDAAVKGDKRLALQALMLDPMAIAPDMAEAMLDELLAASKKFLPQFK